MWRCGLIRRRANVNAGSSGFCPKPSSWWVWARACTTAAPMAAARLLFKNPEYNIAELNVETDGVLTPEVVVAASDLHQGANIFKVDLARAKARVEAIPQVEKAQVTRKLPHKISIQVTERKPIAWVAPEHDPASRDELAASGKSFLIDTHGMLLQPGKTLPQDYHLPIIRNYGASPLSAGMRSRGRGNQGGARPAARPPGFVDRVTLPNPGNRSFQALRIKRARGKRGAGALRTRRHGQAVEAPRHLPANAGAAADSGPPRSTCCAQRNIPVTFITEPVAQPGVIPAGAPVSPPHRGGDPGEFQERFHLHQGQKKVEAA